ncbi:uncharacterized protein FPOAC1_013972 [Fusarium poae]|uniref:uncharacterized protein n=1 Tax=Fusarium poae TaxID=36050 RepID=UPI001D0455DA|nr:uncharacterized protein FPOAC1_013972 [Fusarium poae]KAG8664265.1 hypothetical protein FPOAC1_013972 [Fusarium poae]
MGDLIAKDVATTLPETLPQKRKRGPKASVACDTCRRLKAKCDQNTPCRIRSSAEQTGQAAIASKDVGSEAQSVEASMRSTVSHARDHLTTKSGTDRIPLTPTVRQSQSQSPTNAPIGDIATDSSSDDEASPEGFNETNSRTNGKEFYGPAATLAFLLELRARISAFQRKLRDRQYSRPRTRSRTSLVNLMDGEEVDDSNDKDARRHLVHRTPETPRVAQSPNCQSQSPFHLTNATIEKACIEHYFRNIHHIYSFIDKARFLKRCQTEFWNCPVPEKPERSNFHLPNSTFAAVYNAVIAVGALTAPETFVTDTETSDTAEFWAELIKHSNQHHHTGTQPAPELAEIYFTRARISSSSFFEACNLDSQQAFFLMSIFCTYALKPHASYLYHGMAIRTATAIGVSNMADLRKNPIEGVRTWWMMYYHEMELCLVLGRETCLRDADRYPVFLARFGEPMPPGVEYDEYRFFGRCNTELARILKRILECVYHTGPFADAGQQRPNRHQIALELDVELTQWRTNLKPAYDLDVEPLTEPETVTKRKIILRLRFHFAQIMIHRPFLVNTANSSPKQATLDIHVQKCLGAAIDTIQFLYHTLKYRPFFRSWWYATSYTFNASSVILYCLVTGLYGGRDEAKTLTLGVEKALEILEAMGCITVARRCAKVTREMLEVAEMAAGNIVNGLVEYEQSNTLAAPVTNDTQGGQQRVLVEPLLEDIWEPHYHVGDDMSRAAIHTEYMSSREKGGTLHGLRSANAVLVGIKIWVLISLEAETKVKSFVYENFRDPWKCDRAISHIKILVSSSRLDAQGIAYTIKNGYPGNLVLTEQAQHHMAVNMGPCIAESVNLGLTGDSIRSPDFARCDLDGLDLPHLARKAPAPPVPSKRTHVEKQVQPNKRINTRPRAIVEQAPAALPSQTAETRESRGRAALEQVADQLRSAGHVSITPIILHNLPSDRIYRLMCAFMSRDTIAAFYNSSMELGC